MRLFSNISQLTSKCGKNKKGGIRGDSEKEAIWRNLLSTQNETISLVAMRSNCDCSRKIKPLSNLARMPSGGKSKSRIELRNLQILRKMLEKSKQPCKPKSLDVALNIVGVERIRSENLAVSCGELYFARCCALKRTGTFASESKLTCLFQLPVTLRSDDSMFHSWHQSV